MCDDKNLLSNDKNLLSNEKKKAKFKCLAFFQ